MMPAVAALRAADTHSTSGERDWGGIAGGREGERERGSE